MENDLVVGVQRLFGDAFFDVFDNISDLGTGAPFTAGLLFAFLLFGTRIGLKAGIYFFLASYLTLVLKFLIKAPRPYYVSDNVAALSLSTGYGMPSGHALQVTGGLIAPIWYADRILLKVLLALFVLLVALSRVYLGVHFPSQVLTGVLIGIVIFVAGEWMASWLVSMLKKLSLPLQIVSVLLPVVLMFGIDRGITEIAAAGSPKPAEWQTRYDRIIDDLAETRGIKLDDPRVAERKAEFATVEPRVPLFYLSFAGWLLVSLYFLHHTPFTVTSVGHGLVNVLMGVAIIGPIFAVSFILTEFEPLQMLTALIGPALAGVAIPTVTARWLGKNKLFEPD